MTKIIETRTEFSAGELDPKMLGRIATSAYEKGARRLRNVYVQPTGGVKRRPGMSILLEVPGVRRIIPFDSIETETLIALSANRALIIEDGSIIATIETCPWPASAIDQVSWVQYRDVVLLCHPEYRPQKICKNGSGAWVCESWQYIDKVDQAGDEYSTVPFARFADPEISIQPAAANLAATDPIPSGASITINASGPVFSAITPGSKLRINGLQVAVTSIVNPSRALGKTLQRLDNGHATKNWDEAAFSETRGWPNSLTVHQGRLVLGGSKELPDSLWLSKVGDLFNFDLGTGLDDEAIAVRLVSGAPAAIRYVAPGRHLQIFTDRSEWIMSGRPITPSAFEMSVQTNIGTWARHNIQPLNIDGSTLFIGSNGNELREFLFAETEQAYQAPDLAVMSSHMLDQPKALHFDRKRRLFIVLREDGDAAAITIDRNANIVAWTLFETEGEILSACQGRDSFFMLLNFNDSTFIEYLDDNIDVDHAITFENVEKNTILADLDRYENYHHYIVYGEDSIAKSPIEDGNFTVPTFSKLLTVGAAFRHEIAPLPFLPRLVSGANSFVRYRPIRVSFLVNETKELISDLGNGFHSCFSSNIIGNFTGYVNCAAMGWRRPLEQSPWVIKQDSPSPFTILSVTTEVKVGV